MGRPRKNASEMLLNIAKKYYENVANGDVTQMKCSDIAAYGKKNGCTAEAYDYRRDPQVKQFISGLREKDENTKQEQLETAYKNLDIEELFHKARDFDSLKQRIRGLDNYWKGVCRENVRLRKEKDSLCRECNELKDRISTLENSDAEKAIKISQLEADKRTLTAQVKRLKHYVTTTVYPAIAEEILRSEGMDIPDSQTVTKEGAGKVTEGKTPLPFPGKQGNPPDKMSHIDRLIVQMSERTEKS